MKSRVYNQLSVYKKIYIYIYLISIKVLLHSLPNWYNTHNKIPATCYLQLLWG